MGFMHKDEYEDYVKQYNANVISEQEIQEMKAALSPLIGAQFNILSIPKEILTAFEQLLDPLWMPVFLSYLH